MLLISGTHERAHYAFIAASAAAALGRPVSVFATNQGCHALMRDWSGLSGSTADSMICALGVAGLAELREACIEMGVRLIACEAGLRMAGLDASGLLDRVEVAGIVTFFGAVGGGQFLTL